MYPVLRILHDIIDFKIILSYGVLQSRQTSNCSPLLWMMGRRLATKCDSVSDGEKGLCLKAEKKFYKKITTKIRGLSSLKLMDELSGWTTSHGSRPHTKPIHGRLFSVAQSNERSAADHRSHILRTRDLGTYIGLIGRF